MTTAAKKPVVAAKKKVTTAAKKPVVAAKKKVTKKPAAKLPTPKGVVSKAKEVILDVLQGAVSGAAVGAFGGAVTAVDSHIETAPAVEAITSEPLASDVAEEQKENDSPKTDESTNAAAG